MLCVWENFIVIPTKEMIDWFSTRTKGHIALVQKYAKIIENYDPKIFKGLSDRAITHDACKFEEPDFTPYVFLTWTYRQKDLGQSYEVDDAMKIKMHEATLHHVRTNRHHPEFYDSEAEINTKDRDKNPDRMTDATAMLDLDIGEMVADWLAVAEERGNTPMSWADKTVNKRWIFSDDQVAMIYKVFNHMGENNEN